MNRPDPAGQGSRRGNLNLEAIIDEAMQLARTEGVLKLSMRRLAARLGVEAMSLYYYVPSKAALLVLMADRSAAAVSATDLGPGAWSEQLVELLMCIYRAGVDNPALFEVLAAEPMRTEDLPTTDPDTGSALIGLLGKIIALVREGSLSDSQVAQTFRGLMGLIIGFIVVQVDGLPLAGHATGPDRVGETRLAAIEPALQATDPADGLRLSLELFLDGLSRLRNRTVEG